MWQPKTGMAHPCWSITAASYNYAMNTQRCGVVVAAMDSHLNEKGYIVPGLGDAGDRLYGVVG